MEEYIIGFAFTEVLDALKYHGITLHDTVSSAVSITRWISLEI